ncbi:MAG: endonuclease/exonuclease/phosphatase family protein [Solirubrobacteraceae bacterium]|nr:endonuclease/exonuclease/phosphatase family protein [Solirubrobacteraceae bacterium]
MALAVCTWNLFHGRSRPGTNADLVTDFAAALAAREWDVCGLQESPPWWTRELAQALGASARSARTSWVRAAAPGWQERTHRQDPERLGVKGAGANVLLVRPSAGEIVDERQSTVRWLPQRRSVHAVRLRRPDGSHWWVANVHTHNKPESQAARDTIRTLATVAAWAGDEPTVVLGDLNLAAPQGLVRVEGWEHLHGHRVDHIVARGLRPAGGSLASAGAYAEIAWLRPGVELADHHVVGLSVDVVGTHAAPAPQGN